MEQVSVVLGLLEVGRKCIRISILVLNLFGGQQSVHIALACMYVCYEHSMVNKCNEWGICYKKWGINTQISRDKKSWIERIE